MFLYIGKTRFFRCNVETHHSGASRNCEDMYFAWTEHRCIKWGFFRIKNIHIESDVQIRCMRMYTSCIHRTVHPSIHRQSYGLFVLKKYVFFSCLYTTAIISKTFDIFFGVWSLGHFPNIWHFFLKWEERIFFKFCQISKTFDIFQTFDIFS